MIHGKIQAAGLNHRCDAESLIHPETGEILRRDVRAIEFSYMSEKIIVNMPDCDAALKILKARANEEKLA